MAIPVAIVPHTHWDREWYAPFQTYRLRLVQLLDDLLPLLEHDPSYRHFMLDGQVAVADDYLEVRPEAEATIRRLVRSGRLSIGPWLILMDEFMVSGETTVRNLQMGLARATELGGALPVGYLPDMFGHIGQMPQILRLAGLDHAVVWRGVPRTIRSTGFWWEAPDGSRVRAEYLWGSYSNGRDMPREPDRLVERARAYQAELGPARRDGMLLMNGTDHQMPQPWLGSVVEAANADQSEYEFTITSLADYVAAQDCTDLPAWRGELRSGARANLLMGVASNRVDVHQAAAVAERAVERRAEPLAALALDPKGYPATLLGVAWRNLVLNSAHDSSCACSHDDVVDQVLVRYREARQIGDGIARGAVRALAARVAAPPGSTVVVNPSPRRRRGVIEVSVPGEGPVHFRDPEGRLLPTQELGRESGDLFTAQVTANKIGWVVDLMHGVEFSGVPVKAFRVDPGAEPGSHDVSVEAAGPADEPVSVDPLRQRLREAARPHEGRDDGPMFRIRLLQAPRRRVVFATDPVPGFGWRTYAAEDGPVPARPVTAGGTAMRNEHLDVEIDPTDGTFAVRTHDGVHVEGLNRYVDGGDGGDTYNYSPPTEDIVVATPEAVEVDVVEPGPLRARLLVRSRYRWPSRCEGDLRMCTRRVDERIAVDVHTLVELRTGEPFVRLTVDLENPCRDHRLRAHFPLPATVERSHAECAFWVVERGLESEGGPQEHGLPTFPSRRFVDCSDGDVGLALVHDGLLEYEVTGGGRELALTLLRAVGYLSRVEPALRPNPAGPPIPVAGAQVQGRHRFSYAVVPHRGDWRAADLYRVADDVLLPLEPARVPATGGTAPLTGAMLSVEGAPVSAVARDPGGLVVRVFNPEPEPARVTVARDGAAVPGWLIDLRNRPQRRFDGALDLAPGQIATVLLTEAATPG